MREMHHNTLKPQTGLCLASATSPRVRRLSHNQARQMKTKEQQEWVQTEKTC